MQLGRYGPDGRSISTLHTTTCLRRFGRGPVPFSPYLRGVVRGDSIVFADGPRPELTVLDGTGRVARTISVPIEGIDPGAAWEALEAEIRSRAVAGEGIWSVDQAREIPDRELILHIADLLLDDEGRLWAKRYDPETDNLWTGVLGGFGGD